MRNQILSISILCMLGGVNLSAVTLRDVVSQTLDNHPIIRERLENYRATREEISIADAGYYPTIDLQSSVGRKATGRVRVDREEWRAVSEDESIIPTDTIVIVKQVNGTKLIVRKEE